MRIIVCGGRDYRDANSLQAFLDEIHTQTPVECVIHGASRGADLLAENWARAREIEYVGVPAKWGDFGRKAGPMRNSYMLRFHKPDLVVAFPGGNGTTDMTTKARDAGVRVIVYEERVVERHVPQ